MKMIDTETGHEMVEVSGHDKKEYASKGVAGTGLEIYYLVILNISK